LSTQVVFAEEQPFPAENMGFAFDNTKMSSVQMSALSDSEMDETVGALTTNRDVFDDLNQAAMEAAMQQAW